MIEVFLPNITENSRKKHETSQTLLKPIKENRNTIIRDIINKNDYFESVLRKIEEIKRLVESYEPYNEFVLSRLIFLEWTLYMESVELWNKSHDVANKTLDDFVNTLTEFINQKYVGWYKLQCDWDNVFHINYSLLKITDTILNRYLDSFDSSSLSSRFILGSICEYSIGLTMLLCGLAVSVTGEQSRRHDLKVQYNDIESKNVFYSIKSNTGEFLASNIVLINIMNNTTNIDWIEPTIIYVKNKGYFYIDPHMEYDFNIIKKSSQVVISVDRIMEYLRNHKQYVSVYFSDVLSKNKNTDNKNKMSPNFFIFESLLKDKEHKSKSYNLVK